MVMNSQRLKTIRRKLPLFFFSLYYLSSSLLPSSTLYFFCFAATFTVEMAIFYVHWPLPSEQVCASWSVLSGLLHLRRPICFPPIFVIGLIIIFFLFFVLPLAILQLVATECFVVRKKKSSSPLNFLRRLSHLYMRIVCVVTWFICTLSVQLFFFSYLLFFYTFSVVQFLSLKCSVENRILKKATVSPVSPSRHTNFFLRQKKNNFASTFFSLLFFPCKCFCNHTFD